MVDDADDEATPEGDGEPIDVLQQAALDAIGAARVLLEAAERVVRDPATLRATTDTLAAFGQLATDALGEGLNQLGTVVRQGRERASSASPASSAASADESAPSAGYERIDLD